MLQPDLPLIEVDAGQLQMVLLNLLFNARDAITGQGRIGLTVDVVELAGEVEGLHGGFVRFEVEDSGEGIAPAVLPRIFEPFSLPNPLARGLAWALARCMVLPGRAVVPFASTVSPAGELACNFTCQSISRRTANSTGRTPWHRHSGGW